MEDGELHKIVLITCLFFLPQPGTKTTKSWGNHPWSQVLHWLWREGGQPVHTGCKTGSQNRNGLQGMTLESSLQKYTVAVIYIICARLVPSINVCILEKKVDLLVQLLFHLHPTQYKHSYHSPPTS